MDKQTWNDMAKINADMDQLIAIFWNAIRNLPGGMTPEQAFHGIDDMTRIMADEARIMTNNGQLRPGMIKMVGVLCQIGIAAILNKAVETVEAEEGTNT